MHLVGCNLEENLCFTDQALGCIIRSKGSTYSTYVFVCLFVCSIFFGPRVTTIKLYEHHKEQPQVCICKSVSRPEYQLC